jgi:hypothetical protein
MKCTVTAIFDLGWLSPPQMAFDPRVFSVIWITEIGSTCIQAQAIGSDGRSFNWSRDMQNQQRENKLADGIDSLADEDIELVSGGEQVAHLPQSIHMDYTRLTIDQNPTRYA